MKESTIDIDITQDEVEANGPITLLTLYDRGILCGDEDKSLSATTSGGYAAFAQGHALEDLTSQEASSTPTVDKERR